MFRCKHMPTLLSVRASILVETDFRCYILDLQCIHIVTQARSFSGCLMRLML